MGHYFFSCDLNFTWWVAWTTKVKSISCSPHRQPETRMMNSILHFPTWLLNAKCIHLNISLSSQLESMPLPIVNKGPVVLLEGLLLQVHKKQSTLPEMLNLKAGRVRLDIWQVNCKQNLDTVITFSGCFLHLQLMCVHTASWDSNQCVARLTIRASPLFLNVSNIALRIITKTPISHLKMKEKDDL